MTAAKEFFMNELPGLIAEGKKALGDRIAKVSYEVEFEVEGEGMYSVVVKNGDATVRRGGAATPVVSMLFSKTTWDQALENVIRPRMKSFLLANAEKEIERQLAGRKPVPFDQVLKHVSALPLRVVLELEPSGGHRFELKLAGAEEDDPSVTITLKQEDMENIFAGKSTAEDAFKSGRLRMKGAVSTAMALISRLFT